MFMLLDCEMIAFDWPGDAGEHAHEHAAIPCIGKPHNKHRIGPSVPANTPTRTLANTRPPLRSGKLGLQGLPRPRCQARVLRPPRCHSIGAPNNKHRIGPERGSKHANEHVREHIAILLGSPTISTGSGRACQQTRQRTRSRTRCHFIGTPHNKHRI